MNIKIGTSGYGKRTEDYVSGKPPRITQEFFGTEAEVRATSSYFSNYGWNVTIENGNPWTGKASIEGNLNGNVPVTGSSTTSSVDNTYTPQWSYHFRTTEKELLHCSSQVVSWLNELTPTQKSILENEIPSPSVTGSGHMDNNIGDWVTELEEKYPNFNTGATGSHNMAGYKTWGTAGDVVWVMSRQGFRTIPIVQPILSLRVTLPSGSNLSYYSSNINRVYSKTTLGTQLGVPINYLSVMPQDTDPSNTTTQGVNYIYGWLKQPPSFETQGGNTNLTQEWQYGLYPQNVFNTRI